MSPTQTQPKSAGSAPPPADEKPKIRAVELGRMTPAEENRNAWRLVVAGQAEYEALIGNERDAWKEVGGRLHAGDTIEVVDDASSFFAWLLVRSCITQSRSLMAIEVVELLRKNIGEEVSTSPRATGDWYVCYRGNFSKWCLIRPNGLIARERMHTREEAQIALANEMIMAAGGRPS
jgi:hypothetical protein